MIQKVTSPTKGTPRALLVDHDEKALSALDELTRREGYSTCCARSIEEARDRLRNEHADVILLDMFLPDGSGLELLEQLNGSLTAQVILMADESDVGSAAANLGERHAGHYFAGKEDLAGIRSRLADLAAERRAANSGAAADAIDDQHWDRCGLMLGNSQSMRKVFEMISRVAPTDATVLLIGESGTGKELAARAIHEESRKRRNGEFLAINCGAIPETLIESELFGHEKGSFTGASHARKGVFERASGGTLFLDEITEMPYGLQVKLLRVLETSRVLPVGGEKEVKFDVRVIAATNRDPGEAVAKGLLREDLLYRLSVFPIRMPPLRERDEDVELLARHFLAGLNMDADSQKRLSANALETIRDHAWPGNVRQLKNWLHQSFILADDIIECESIPSLLDGSTTSCGKKIELPVGISLADAEQLLIAATLEHFDGDKRKTAKTLGFSLKTLYNRLNAYKNEDSPEED